MFNPYLFKTVITSNLMYQCDNRKIITSPFNKQNFNIISSIFDMIPQQEPTLVEICLSSQILQSNGYVNNINVFRSILFQLLSQCAKDFGGSFPAYKHKGEVVLTRKSLYFQAKLGLTTSLFHLTCNSCSYWVMPGCEIVNFGVCSLPLSHWFACHM